MALRKLPWKRLAIVGVIVAWTVLTSWRDLRLVELSAIGLAVATLILSALEANADGQTRQGDRLSTLNSLCVTAMTSLVSWSAREHVDERRQLGYHAIVAQATARQTSNELAIVRQRIHSRYTGTDWEALDRELNWVSRFAGIRMTKVNETTESSEFAFKLHEVLVKRGMRTADQTIHAKSAPPSPSDPPLLISAGPGRLAEMLMSSLREALLVAKVRCATNSGGPDEGWVDITIYPSRDF